jgi:hypothetical protein
MFAAIQGMENALNQATSVYKAAPTQGNVAFPQQRGIRSNTQRSLHREDAYQHRPQNHGIADHVNASHASQDSYPQQQQQNRQNMMSSHGEERKQPHFLEHGQERLNGQPQHTSTQQQGSQQLHQRTATVDSKINRPTSESYPIERTYAQPGSDETADDARPEDQIYIASSAEYPGAKGKYVLGSCECVT